MRSHVRSSTVAAIDLAAIMNTLTEKQKAYHLLKMRTRAKRTDLNQDGFLSREDFEIISRG